MLGVTFWIKTLRIVMRQCYSALKCSVLQLNNQNVNRGDCLLSNVTRGTCQLIVMRLSDVYFFSRHLQTLTCLCIGIYILFILIKKEVNHF